MLSSAMMLKDGLILCALLAIVSISTAHAEGYNNQMGQTVLGQSKGKQTSDTATQKSHSFQWSSSQEQTKKNDTTQKQWKAGGGNATSSATKTHTWSAEDSKNENQDASKTIMGWTTLSVEDETTAPK